MNTKDSLKVGITVVCECCALRHERRDCPSCALYDAAVTAQGVAAQSIARSYEPRAKNAWLNEYGVFADVGGIKRQVASATEAAPFAALTTEARKVRKFFSASEPQ